MKRRLLIAAVALVVLAVAAGSFLFLYRPSPGRAVEVEVVSGATTKQVADLLSSNDVIDSTVFFRVMARVRGLDGVLQAGRYEMARGMGVQAALDVLSKAPIEKGVTVPIPEGFSLRQIAERMDARTQIVQADFVTAATNGSVRASIQPPGVNTLEGLLFPETYFVGERESAAGLARRMVEQFEQRTRSLDWSFPEGQGLSKYQTLVIASLVEREARVDEDRSKVSAVIYNRLAKGMRLQIDITALYGLDEHKVPTRADLQRPSPYNTYLIDGLPPTPIASPGLDSIEAALHPASGDWIYYVVIDPSGKHGFTNSPEEFERLKQQRPPEVH
ncbi:MAG: endolytic transglycosylase MltG [Actinomycetota bacterium]